MIITTGTKKPDAIAEPLKVDDPNVSELLLLAIRQLRLMSLKLDILQTNDEEIRSSDLDDTLDIQ